MATSNQDTNIKDVAAPASATPTNIGHLLGLNAAKTQDVLIPLSMLRTVIAAELKTALAAITSGSPDVPVLDGNNLKYMTLANFAKVVGGHSYHAVTTAVNANDYMENAVITMYTAAFTAGSTNFPVSSFGVLYVEKLGSASSALLVIQEYKPLSGGGTIYRRVYNSNSWGAWQANE